MSARLEEAVRELCSALEEATNEGKMAAGAAEQEAEQSILTFGDLQEELEDTRRQLRELKAELEGIPAAAYRDNLEGDEERERERRSYASASEA